MRYLQFFVSFLNLTGLCDCADAVPGNVLHSNRGNPVLVLTCNAESSEAQVWASPSFSLLLQDWKRFEGGTFDVCLVLLCNRVPFVLLFLEFAHLSLYVWGQYACTRTFRAVTVLRHKGWKMYWHWPLPHNRNMRHSGFVSRPKGCLGRHCLFFHYMLCATSPLDFLFQVPEILRDTPPLSLIPIFGFHTIAPPPKTNLGKQTHAAVTSWRLEHNSSFCGAVAGFCRCISEGHDTSDSPSSQSVDCFAIRVCLKYREEYKCVFNAKFIWRAIAVLSFDFDFIFHF